MYEIIQQFSVPVQYRVMFTHGVFKTPDTALSSVLLQADNTVRHRILPIIDSGVLEAWPGLPAQIRTYADDHAELIELVRDPFIVDGDSLVVATEIPQESFVYILNGNQDSMLKAAGESYTAALKSFPGGQKRENGCNFSCNRLLLRVV